VCALHRELRYCLSNAMHNSIGQNIKSLDVFGVRCPCQASVDTTFCGRAMPSFCSKRTIIILFTTQWGSYSAQQALTTGDQSSPFPIDFSGRPYNSASYATACTGDGRDRGGWGSKQRVLFTSHQRFVGGKPYSAGNFLEGQGNLLGN